MITILKKVIKSNQSKNATSRINTEKLMLCARVESPYWLRFRHVLYRVSDGRRVFFTLKSACFLGMKLV
nr:MAG TPA: hypothetical protein [Caudoviricetes sp.]